MRPTRPISWFTPARKAFEGFPDGAPQIMMDAFKTPKHEIDLIKYRLRRLKEMLR